MKLSVKTFALLASLARVHARVLDTTTTCEENQAEPDGRESQIVELSYFHQLEWIPVSIKDGIPDKIFKFSGCGVEKGTKFFFRSCSQEDGLDPVFTLWTREELDYDMDRCVDGSLCRVTDEWMCECLAHYNDEYYFRPGLKDGADGTFNVAYKAVPVGPDPIDWPCFDSVTATYVHGSTVLDFDDGVVENIVADFFYTGEKDDRKFDVVIFRDQTCTLGHEIAGTVGGPFGTPPPFVVTTIVDPSAGSYPTEYTQVKIKANPTEWESSYWDSDINDDGDGKTGQLKICVQFQVRDDTDPYHMHEFVDVAYTINIDLMEVCSCDDPSAKETPEAGRCRCPCDSANPTCGAITLIRDYVIGEDLDTDPDIGMTCAPCDGNMTVTQGEKFPVCMALVNDGDTYCLSDPTALSLVVKTSDTVSITYQILPTPEDDRIIAGPLECDDDGMCVIQMTPPAELIAQLEAGKPGSSYTGYFAGAAEVDFGTCDNRRRELKEAVYTTFVGQEFTMNYAKKEEEEECDGRFFAKLLCRFREWLRQIRGKS